MAENIKDNTLLSSNFLSRSMKSPLLSKDQEQSLTRLWKDNKDPQALEKIILSYSKLVIRIASQHWIPFMRSSTLCKFFIGGTWLSET